MPDKKYLMVVMAGENSVFENNIAPYDERNFDIWVVYYGNDDNIADKYKNVSDRFWRAKGMKLDLMRKVLFDEVAFKEQFDFAKYEYVFIPDDDIKFIDGHIGVNQFFEAASRLNVDTIQPAIINEYWTWSATRKIEDMFCHQVTWCEVMMVAFRGQIFKNVVLPVLHTIDFWSSGHGFEAYLNRFTEATLARNPVNVVLDACGVVHTRPVGNNKAIHAQGRFEVFMMPQYQWLLEMETIAEFKNEAEFAPLPILQSDKVIKKRQQVLDEYKHFFSKRKSAIRWHRRKRRFKEAINRLFNK